MVPGNVNRKPVAVACVTRRNCRLYSCRSFEIDVVPHMVNVGFRVSAVLVFAVGVTVYGYAGDSQLIHYYFVGSGIASADCFAFYKSAVRCVDISRGDVVGVVFIVIRT